MSNPVLTFLQHIGQEFKSGLKLIAPIFVKVTQIAAAAAPEVAIFNPLLGAAFQSTVAVVSSVEQKFAAMGQQNGTGPQKLADATTILTPLLSQILADAGAQNDQAGVQKYINAVVAFLNALPAPSAAPAPTP